jgi:tungstate transport system substrate-binding protein
LALVATTLVVSAQPRPLVLAATTSVEDSGLFEHLLPKFTARSGVVVRMISRSTAQVLTTAERGLVDVVITNDPGALDRFFDSGSGMKRHRMMFNDYVIVGPPSDPARLRESKDAPAALRTLARLRAPFLSRGDDSGTHHAEMRLWQAARVNPKARSGNWYIETGLGMGVSVDLASRLKAYILTDRATWMARRGNSDLEIIVENDPLLFNQYEIALVNPKKHPQVNLTPATEFINWIVSEEGQRAIASFEIGGAPVFRPNAQGQN